MFSKCLCWGTVSLACIGPAGWRLSALLRFAPRSFRKTQLVATVAAQCCLLTQASDLEEVHSAQCLAVISMKSLGSKIHIWRHNRGKASMSKSRLYSCHRAMIAIPNSPGHLLIQQNTRRSSSRQDSRGVSICNTGTSSTPSSDLRHVHLYYCPPPPPFLFS